MSQRRQPTLACPRKPQCDGRPVDRTMRREAAERMVFRPMGRTGEPYPPWVRDLKGKSGAYVIRAVGLFSSTIVYVGESHAGRLYDTICRHFQGWRREKTRWLGFFVPSDNDPGTTYDREVCEVAVRVTAVGCDLGTCALQKELIRKWKPRDNILDVPKPDADDPPF